MPKEFTRRPILKHATTPAERQSALNMLQTHNLPTSDIDDEKRIYLLMDNGRIIGTAGVETFNDCALLRSVTVLSEEQGKGYGGEINRQIENILKDQGVGCLYLLTTTAKAFFEKNGYSVVESRHAVPLAIRQTAEFNSLCPATAVVMKKYL